LLRIHRHFHPIESSPRAGQPLEKARFGADFLVRLRTDPARWKASRRLSTAETLRSSGLGEFSTERVSGWNGGGKFPTRRCFSNVANLRERERAINVVEGEVAGAGCRAAGHPAVGRGVVGGSFSFNRWSEKPGAGQQLIKENG